MIAVTLGEIAALTRGELIPGSDPTSVVRGGVAIDSREVQPGGLFAALPGQQADGHDFATAAVDAGAAAVLAARPIDAPGVIVADVPVALGALARAVLDRGSARVVGVTGSSGKTTTKDMLAQVLATTGPTVSPRNSFNNEIGLPLTVCRVEEETAWLVLEYSARGPGHIRALTEIARPEIAAVLNVGRAHVGEFGDIDAIATAKAELAQAVPPTGAVVLNADDPRVAAMASGVSGEVVMFGRAAEADVHISAIEPDELDRPRLQLETSSGRIDVQLQFVGDHQASNAAAVAALALTAGLSLEAVAVGLEAATQVSRHRMELHRLPDGTTIVDDAYNANPESMRAALDALARLPGKQRWAILGPMRELGAGSADMHAEVGRHAASVGVDRLLIVGEDAAPIAAGARATAGWTGRVDVVADAVEATRWVDTQRGAGDAILVKASNSVRLWSLAEHLIGADAAGGGSTPAESAPAVGAAQP